MASAYTPVKRIQLVREGSLRGRFPITNTVEAEAFFKAYWESRGSNDQESFVVAGLNTRNVVMSVVEVTRGTLDASLVHPREVFKPAIVEGSQCVIVSHNHPSGEVCPSREDQICTERLYKAGEVLGVKLLDHIIYGDGTGETHSLARFCR